MKKNITKILLEIFFLLIGVACGVLRGVELSSCYDNYTGLYNVQPVTFILPALLILAMIAVFYITIKKRSTDNDYVHVYKASQFGAMLVITSGFILLTSGAARCVSFFSGRAYTDLLLGLLTALAGVAMIALAIARRRGIMSEMTSLGGVLLVFWGCFMLIQVFMEHPVEPVKFLYAYDLLAMCLSLLAIYSSGAQLFTMRRARMALFSSLGASLFLLTSGLGRFMAFVLSGDITFITDVLFRLSVYAALFLYCTANSIALLDSLPRARGRRIQNGIKLKSN